MPFENVEFLGVAFAPLDRAAALDAVVARASRPGFAYVVTPNVDHVVALAQGDARLSSAYADAWLRVNDSRVLERMARWSGIRLPAASGADLAADIFAQALSPEEPVAVIGADAALIAALAARYGLKDLRWHAPPMGLASHPAAIAEAAAFAAAQRARFTFLCMGAPQQEMVAQAIAARGDAAGVGLCVGAALMFLGGRTPRAPVWVQRAGLEWAFRLGCEPRRLWRRYLVRGPLIGPLWLSWRWAQGKGRRAAIASRSPRWRPSSRA